MFVVNPSLTEGRIEDPGGKIWMESVFGEGATFFFNLPIVERRGSHGKEDTYSR